MIELRTGNILQADVEALVNTVNCVGVMGRGIALQFRKAFPDNFKVYRATCDRKQLRPGMMLVFDRSCLLNPRYIINFPTKRHWRGKSRIEDIGTDSTLWWPRCATVTYPRSRFRLLAAAWVVSTGARFGR